MEEGKQYRHELKYAITYADYLAMSKRLAPVMIPWDYNLSFGGMSMGASSGSNVVNDAIDTPFAGTQFFDALLENEEYRERYHEYLRQLVDEYVDGGRFEEVYSRIRSQIDELVKEDPNAF